MASLTDAEVKEIHQATFKLLQERELEDAARLTQRVLEHDPNDATSLNFLGVIHLELQNFQIAYQYLRRAIQEKPGMAQMWANFGMAAHELGRNEEAIRCYLKAAELDNGYLKAYVNAAAVFIEESKWDEAEKSCELALDIDSDSELAKKNLAHVFLAKHRWSEGWKFWDLSLGSKYRKEWLYGPEKRWDGTKDQCVVVYGEQGLGDEINYASVLPDAIKDCKKIIVDCDTRLEKLFRRSFPKASVYGTRRQEHPKWLEGSRIDARCAISTLPMFYRNSDSDLPGTPYLQPDPELVRMWKGLFSSWGRPVYGLCLHGGSKMTGAAWRKISPEDFSPLFARDAEFVSLDYKGHHSHKKIREYPWATQVDDYDLTASLIAALDAVIGVNTTAIHCANGLGVPAHILVPTKKQWRYEPCEDGSYVWSKSAKLYHQKAGEGWRDVIKRVQL